jgi:hypothetical protein
MFNVDTRTTLTLARLHQSDITRSFPRKRRTFRPNRNLSPSGAGVTDAGALPAPSLPAPA